MYYILHKLCYILCSNYCVVYIACDISDILHEGKLRITLEDLISLPDYACYTVYQVFMH